MIALLHMLVAIAGAAVFCGLMAWAVFASPVVARRSNGKRRRP